MHTGHQSRRVSHRLGVPNPGGLKHVLDRLKWALGLKNGRLSRLTAWFALRHGKWGEKLCTLRLRVFRTTRVRAGARRGYSTPRPRRLTLQKPQVTVAF